jgi:hypothetical protein
MCSPWRTRPIYVTVSVCNSDLAVMLLADRWMRRLAGRAIDYVVTYHPDQKPEVLAAFWSEYLGLPADAVRCTPKSNSGRLSGRVWRCEHGVLAIVSYDTYFRARLGAWIDSIKGEWAEFSR